MATDSDSGEWQGCGQVLRDVKASWEYAFRKSAFYFTGRGTGELRWNHARRKIGKLTTPWILSVP